MSDGYGGKLEVALASVLEAGDSVEWVSADGGASRYVVSIRTQGKRIKWRPGTDGASYVCPFRSFALWVLVNDATPRTKS